MSNKQTSNNRARRQRQRARKQNKLRKQTNDFLGANNKFINLKKSHLSKCTQMYAKALVNPFGDFDELPCIPDALILPSQKVRTFAKGTFSTGTRGIGFISMDPFRMLYQGGSLATPGGAINNSFPINYTTDTFQGTDYTYASGSTLLTGVNAAQASSIFPESTFANPQKQFRLVGAGLSIRYVGSTFQNQGLITMVRSPGNFSIAQGSTEADLNQFQNSNQAPCSRMREYVTYTPDAPQFLGYATRDDYDALTSGSALSCHKSLLIFVSGGSISTPQRWQFEAVAFFEVIGPDFTLSPSHADPIGAPVLQASLPVKVPIEPPQYVENNLLQKTIAAIGETVSMVAPPLARGALRLGTQLAVKALETGASSSGLLSGPDRLRLMM